MKVKHYIDKDTGKVVRKVKYADGRVTYETIDKEKFDTEHGFITGLSYIAGVITVLFIISLFI
jgi:hypothetical protein